MLKQMEPTAVEVGGKKFYIRPFAAFKAANLSGELASVLAPLLGVLGPLSESEDIGDIDISEIAKAFSNCSAIDGDKIEKLARKLLLGGNVIAEVQDDDGNRDTQVLGSDLADEIFCGEIDDMFILCYHVIRINFKGFFGKLGSLSGKAASKGPQKTPRKVF